MRTVEQHFATLPRVVRPVWVQLMAGLTQREIPSRDLVVESVHTNLVKGQLRNAFAQRKIKCTHLCGHAGWRVFSTLLHRLTRCLSSTLPRDPVSGTDPSEIGKESRTTTSLASDT